MKRLFVAILCTACMGSLAAQTTLDDYRSAVMDYSWELRIAASRTEAAAETMGAAYTGHLPKLSADGSFSVAMRQRDGVKPWTFSVVPQIVQVIYGGGAVRAAYHSAELGYDIALCEQEFSRLDVRYAADYAYWNLSSVEAYATVMRRYVEIIRSLKEVVERRFVEGYVAKGDVLMIDTRLNEAEYELVTAEQNLTVALHNFNILRGVFVDERVMLTQSIRDSIALPERLTLDQTLLQRSDFAAASLRTNQAEEGVRAARAPFNPQLSVGVSGSWQPDAPNQTGRTSIDGLAFMKLSVPIFHWGERRRTVGVARANAEQSEWNAALLRDNILREEINGWTAVVDSREQVAVTERSLGIAGENLDISTYSYREGMATVLDVLQAQLSWIQLYSNTIQAHYNYAVAVSGYLRTTAR